MLLSPRTSKVQTSREIPQSVGTVLPTDSKAMVAQLRALTGQKNSNARLHKQDIQRQTLESKLMGFEDYYGTTEYQRRMQRYEDELLMVSEDNFSAWVERQYKETAKDAFRQKIREEVEARQRAEEAERMAKKLEAEKRRTAVLERIRKQKEAEELKRLEEERELQRQKDEEMMIVLRAAMQLERERSTMTSEDSFSREVEQFTKEENERKAWLLAEQRRIDDWEAQQREKDILEQKAREERAHQIAATRAKLQALKEQQALSATTAPPTAAGTAELLNEAARLNKQMRIQNKAKYVTKKIKAGETPALPSAEVPTSIETADTNTATVVSNNNEPIESIPAIPIGDAASAASVPSQQQANTAIAPLLAVPLLPLTAVTADNNINRFRNEKGLSESDRNDLQAFFALVNDPATAETHLRSLQKDIMADKRRVRLHQKQIQQQYLASGGSTAGAEMAAEIESTGRQLKVLNKKEEILNERMNNSSNSSLTNNTNNSNNTNDAEIAANIAQVLSAAESASMPVAAPMTPRKDQQQVTVPPLPASVSASPYKRLTSKLDILGGHDQQTTAEAVAEAAAAPILDMLDIKEKANELPASVADHNANEEPERSTDLLAIEGAIEVTTCLEIAADKDKKGNHSNDDEDDADEVDGDSSDGVDFEKLPGWKECSETTMSTVAHHAAFHGFVEVLEVLSRYFDCFVMDAKGRTPLFYAALGNRLDCAALLVSIDPQWLTVGDQRGDTSLHAAAIANSLDVLSFFLTCEANPDTANYEGLTCSHLARSVPALKLLHQAGATLYCVDNSSKMPIHLACSDNRPDCVRFLASITPPEFLLWGDLEGNSCLHVAAVQGHCDCVEALCDCEQVRLEDLNVVNRKQHTAAHVAKNFRVLQVLYEHGADLWALDSKGRYPLFTEAFMNHADAVVFLLEIGLQKDMQTFQQHHQQQQRLSPRAGGRPQLPPQPLQSVICSRDVNGDTALHAACLCGHVAAASLLLYFIPDEPNGQGLTPSQLAQRAGHSALATLVATATAHRASNNSNMEGIFGCKFEAHSAVVLYFGSRWCKLYDHSVDALYYCDRVTGLTQWERPLAFDLQPKDEAKEDQARQVLKDFYAQHNPGKITDINDILAMYKLEYKDLFVSLANKYGVKDHSFFAGLI